MKDFHLNPDWYRAKYSLASERLSLATNGDVEKRAERLRLARECVRELLAQIKSTLDDRRGKEHPDAELRGFIADDVRPNAQLLLAQIEIAEEGDAEPESTVKAVLDTAPHTSELDYSIARLYAQAEVEDLARQYLDAAVDRAEPNDWQALAHRIVRDPLLEDVASASLGSVEGFAPRLAAAREDTGAEDEPQDLD
jgi:predicted Zn-dependent protease